MTQTVAAVMKYYRHVRDQPGGEWLRWSKEVRPMRKRDAHKFFVGVMLDQLQPAERAWRGAAHLVDSHFQGKGNWWRRVAKARIAEVQAVCKYGFEGQSYAVGFPANQFPLRLHHNAGMMVERYGGDPRGIWSDVTPSELYWKFRDFDGIGEALAKMGTFLLVREYGMAGGRSSRRCLWVKPDKHVRLVTYRLGISPTTRMRDVVRAVETLQLASPADFDAALYLIGQRFCSPKTPNCADCPVGDVCIRRGVRSS